ncbi:MAG: 3-carboxy-cis,cis-muconate cycloisomerase [Vicinamibacterales bacterium]
MSSEDDVARVFGDVVRVQRMLDVEVALARAEAAAGVIPQLAAEAIAAAADVGRFDLAALHGDARTAGNLAIPLVKALTTVVAAQNERASHFVHWGATSQDIIDSGLVLQLREAVPIVVRDLRRAAAAATRHATRHARTTMAGRTWLQQATPITFGLKAAGWLDALSRVTTGLETALHGALVLQFGGASGTLAALGADGLNVASRLGALLDLHVPPAPWHAHRDRLATLACALGVTCGTLGKIARDLSLLGQTEVQEVVEAAGKAGGSSTMPHKRNPVRASRILASALRAPGLVATMLSAMPHEHERGLGGWQAEWDVLPELVIVAAAAAAATADVLEELDVRPDAMARGLAVTNGLTMAESVATALAVHVGRPEAHRLVERAAAQAIERGVPFAAALTADTDVTRHLDRGAIADALAPDDYLGVAVQFIGRVLAATASRTPHE